MTPNALLTDATTRRPSFRDGQVLRAVDLRADDAERTSAARRHAGVVHLPGIVGGLWLRCKDNDALCTISPGMAIDGAGRSILIGRELSVTIPDSTLDHEIWLAHVETPDDAASTRMPSAPPARYTETYQFLFEPIGRYNPAQPEDHPRKAIFLGVIPSVDSPLRNETTTKMAPAQNHARKEGRLYTSVIGGRIDSPTGQARLILGPEGPSDFRLFAIASRDKPNGTFRDHLAVDSSGTLLLSSPTELDLTSPTRLAVVEAGAYANRFTSSDVVNPVAFANLFAQDEDVILAYLRQTYFGASPSSLSSADRLWLMNQTTDPPPPAQLAISASRLLNLIVEKETADARVPKHGLSTAARQSARVFSSEIKALLDAEQVNAPQADPERLARRILEEVFIDLIRPLPTPVDPEGPRGVSFNGGRPEPTIALPGQIYLTTIVEKTQTRHELRLEIKNPGKDNNPERYQMAVGRVNVEQATPATGDPPSDPQGVFHGILQVDASGNVKINDNLSVFPSWDKRNDDVPGLILRVQPSNSSGSGSSADSPGSDADVLPPLIGLVAPWDLVLAEITAVGVDTSHILIKGKLKNTGRAQIDAVQVLVKAVVTDDSTVEPALLQLCRGVSIPAGQSLDLDGKPLGTAPVDRILLPLPMALQDRKMTVTLTAIGFAPPNVLTNADRQIFLTMPH